MVSLAALVLLSPLMLAAAIAIKLDSEGPVFFRQTRHGFSGRPFGIYKFRSMTVLEDGDVVRQAEKRDARVTRVGYWIRRYSIDERPPTAERSLWRYVDCRSAPARVVS